MTHSELPQGWYVQRPQGDGEIICVRNCQDESIWCGVHSPAEGKFNFVTSPHPIPLAVIRFAIREVECFHEVTFVSHY